MKRYAKQDVTGLPGLQGEDDIVECSPREYETIEALLSEIREVGKTGELPDGDQVNMPTLLWLEELVERMDKEAK